MSFERPSGQDLLNTEAQVRRMGTGIGVPDLVGQWRLRDIWPRGQSAASALASLGLQSVGATLELEDSPPGLLIANAVGLGPLKLRFSGTAELVGRRPLLQFWFSTVELRWGQSRLWQRSLPMPANQQRPFFALIARDSRGWLAARGRGGGLALWELA